jgi:hypothetical protein
VICLCKRHENKTQNDENQLKEKPIENEKIKVRIWFNLNLFSSLKRKSKWTMRLKYFRTCPCLDCDDLYHDCDDVYRVNVNVNVSVSVNVSVFDVFDLWISNENENATSCEKHLLNHWQI